MVSGHRTSLVIQSPAAFTTLDRHLVAASDGFTVGLAVLLLRRISINAIRERVRAVIPLACRANDSWCPRRDLDEHA
ncbi:MAG: hypothetical protein CMH41_03815 [Micrococcales bacterium]|nr:hypothetical protein [Micrococcales bacterium]